MCTCQLQPTSGNSGSVFDGARASHVLGGRQEEIRYGSLHAWHSPGISDGRQLPWHGASCFEFRLARHGESRKRVRAHCFAYTFGHEGYFKSYQCFASCPPLLSHIT